MKITNLNLYHFRAAKELNIDLHHQMNLFVGVNGAGKSTVLQAIAYALTPLVRKIQNSKSSRKFLSVSDIHQKESQTSITIRLDYNNQSFSWNIERTRPGENGEIQEKLDELESLSLVLKTKYQQEESLPVMVYYPVGRVVNKQNIVGYVEDLEQFDIYRDALEGKPNFQSFFDWFREQDDFINQKLLEGSIFKGSIFNENVLKNITDDFKETTINSAPNRFTRGIHNVIRAIEQLVPEYTNFRINRDGRGSAQMLVDKDGIEFDINQLSDGEKNLIALMGDIARRLTIGNPGLDDPLKGSGIVLIDEIDLHLHPKWQRVVAEKLTQIFPNCQFIISTRSPQVISHIKPESVFVLKNDNGVISKYGVNDSYGKNSDRILEDIMDGSSRPPMIEEEIKVIFRLIQQGKIDEAKTKILLLQEQIGEDGELIKANVLIRRKEIIGK